MEPVAGKHIENLRITPDIDRNLLTVKAELNSACPSDFVEVNVYDGNQLVATGSIHTVCQIPLTGVYQIPSGLLTCFPRG